MKRITGILGLAVLALGAAGALQCGKTSDLQGAVVTAAKGSVTTADESGKQRAFTNADLYTKAGLLTPGMSLWTGPESSADLQFATGLVMRVSACSKMKLETARIV